ncbi:VWA domain-containing protein [Streptomyces sp. NPDC093094]|uniref:vWA domain-containing protein n=1 Tax=Streptomyces sp. NPDC093094 TaxID=3366026 RepID=UPI00382D9C71
MGATSTPSGFEMRVTAGKEGRRLPIYLLLDCSASMEGPPLEALKEGLETFTAETKRDVLARETVHVGVIAFQGEEAQLVPDHLVTIDDFAPPPLKAEGLTPLGAALRELARSVDRDTKPTVKGKPPGDWKPLVYILTDGQPTDEWQGPRREIQDRAKQKVLNVITVGCGPGIDRPTLEAIAIGPTFYLDNQDSDTFKTFFGWVTQTAVSASHSFEETPDATPGDVQVAVPNPPPEVRPVLNF